MDLWDNPYDDDEAQALSDSDGEVEEVVDTDFLLPNNKRRKLQKQFSGATRGRHGAAAAERPEQEKEQRAAAEAADSDIDLLDSPSDSQGPELAKPPATAQPATAARRPVLDPKSSDLLQQLRATQNAMMVAAAEVDLTEEEEGAEGEDPTEPSPVQLRHAGRRGSGAAQQQQGGVAEGDDGDDGFEILEDNLGCAAGAAAAAVGGGDKIPLKLQSAKGTKVLKMRKSDPFRKMFEVYRKFAHQQGWIPSPDVEVRFNFDGDDMFPDDTPEDLELEGEEMIEVRF